MGRREQKIKALSSKVDELKQQLCEKDREVKAFEEKIKALEEAAVIRENVWKKKMKDVSWERDGWMVIANNKKRDINIATCQQELRMLELQCELTERREEWVAAEKVNFDILKEAFELHKENDYLRAKGDEKDQESKMDKAILKNLEEEYQVVLKKDIIRVAEDVRADVTFFGVGNKSPLEWNVFFDAKTSVDVNGDSFCVYSKRTAGPVFYLLHGGGYSGLTWACLTEELCQQIECRVVAPDLRGHGETTCADEVDLSVERQVNDIIAVHAKLFEAEVPTVLVGHRCIFLVKEVVFSMGGALAVHVAASNRLKGTCALIVIDVVEGTAMESLSQMSRFLDSRPTSFKSLEAIDWCLHSKIAKNSRAARISMPAQLKEKDGKYLWRIDLGKTEPHWVGWFKGLSKLFLSCSVPKILVLAGVDRLDTDLTVGQMQGKFQNTILPKVGHVVQEDSPDKLADVLATFAIRFRMCTQK